MSTSRLDDFTDSAWLLIAAATIILLVERILKTLEALMQACQCEVNQTLLITHAAIMVLVSIAAATIALPDKWVQSIVQAMFVGIGFALKEVLTEVLAGLNVMKMKNARTSNDVVFKDKNETYEVVAANLLHVALRSKDKSVWHVPWTTLQSQWICFKKKESS